MNDLISRQALMDAFGIKHNCEDCEYSMGGGPLCTWNCRYSHGDICEAICTAPSVTPGLPEVERQNHIKPARPIKYQIKKCEMSHAIVISGEKILDFDLNEGWTIDTVEFDAVPADEIDRLVVTLKKTGEQDGCN